LIRELQTNRAVELVKIAGFPKAPPDGALHNGPAALVFETKAAPPCEPGFQMPVLSAPGRRTGSLRALKEVFPVRRAALLEALERFGFDFYDLLKKDFELGHSDAQIGWRHGVDAKWIQAQRRRLGLSRSCVSVISASCVCQRLATSSQIRHVAYKRIEGKGFEWPRISDGIITINKSQFEALFEGLDWKRVTARSVRRPVAV
jgi:hypothetical protein